MSQPAFLSENSPPTIDFSGIVAFFGKEELELQDCDKSSEIAIHRVPSNLDFDSRFADMSLEEYLECKDWVID